MSRPAVQKALAATERALSGIDEELATQDKALADGSCPAFHGDALLETGT